ncbi:MAG TPA: LytTR family DNA-binding domain-containing protein [Bacteroidales bacterium]|nr:LytTR family DNA-binding domain-containing protein [Bacteroidales bacterium]
MITVIAIDDEPLALQLIVEYIQKTPGLELAGQFENPVEAVQYISNNHIDLVFTDIQMPGLNGIEFTRSMVNGPVVIFTTAFDAYAIDGFKLDIADYLLKPFTYEEFLRSVHKAGRMLSSAKKPVMEVLSDNEFLFLKSDYKIKRINFRNILYIEGLKEYVRVYTTLSDRAILSLSSLKMMEKKLPDGKFMRVHRSFIVNLEKVETIDRSRIVFGKKFIPVGNRYKDRFQEFLDKNFL